MSWAQSSWPSADLLLHIPVVSHLVLLQSLAASHFVLFPVHHSPRILTSPAAIAPTIMACTLTSTFNKPFKLILGVRLLIGSKTLPS